MRIVSVVFLAFALTASSAHAATDSIVGNWYEDETYGGKRVIAVGHFKADGTFSVDFRTCLKKGTLDHTAAGHWTYAGGKLRMITETDSGLWVYEIEDYQTISNDGHLWVYKSTAGDAFQEYGQVTFRDVHVTPDSKVPDCALTS